MKSATTFAATFNTREDVDAMLNSLEEDPEIREQVQQVSAHPASDSAGTRMVPLASTRMPAAFARGAVLGGLFGGLFAGLIALLIDSWETAAYVGAIGAVLGAAYSILAGALFGAAVPDKRVREFLKTGSHVVLVRGGQLSMRVRRRIRTMLRARAEEVIETRGQWRAATKSITTKIQPAPQR